MSFPRVLLCTTLFLTLLAPGQAVAQDSPVGPDPAALRAIETQVSALRGLPAQSEVNLKVLDQAGLQQYLTDAFERDYLPDERESDQKLYVALGLLKPADDLVKIQ